MLSGMGAFSIKIFRKGDGQKMDETIDYKSLEPAEQKRLACEMYIESRMNHEYGERLTQAEIGKMFGHNQQWVSAALADEGTLDRLERRTRSDVIIARAMANKAAPEMMLDLIKSARKKRADQFEYITQQDRRDILDRAGVRAEKQEATDVTIRFADGVGFATGMPSEVD